MKFSKSLFLAFAGLGLFACSNEDVTEGGAQGNANVSITVKQMTLGSRNSEAGINDGTQATVKTMDVILTAGGTHKKTLTSVTSPQTITFEKVGVPTALEVSVNDGDESLVLTNDIIKGGAAAPMWVKATGTAESEGEANKIYKADEQNYKIAATPAFQVARLELSGIQYQTTGLGEDGTVPAYTDVKLIGVYLNNVLKSIGGEKCSVKGESAWSEMTANTWGPSSSNLEIYDKIEEASEGAAIDEGTPYPTDGSVIAYNFIPSDKAENVVLVLSAKPWGEETSVTYYAKVETYKQSGGNAITQFNPGSVYSIKSMKITDEAITTDPEAPKNITVEATVTISNWTVVNTEIGWEDQE